MAPYDRSSDGGELPLYVTITDHGRGIHSIRQYDGSQDFEVKLMSSSSSSRLSPTIKKKLKKMQQQSQQQHEDEAAANRKMVTKRWAFKKIEKTTNSINNSNNKSHNSKKQKKESKSFSAATLFSSGKKKQKKSPSKKEKHQVSFNYETRIREIPHKSEISPELKAQMWVNYHDWQATQNERQRISRAILFGNLTRETQTDDLFLRGFETLIPEWASLRRDTIHSAKTLVLREQARARLEEEPLDVERLARWYASATKESRNIALEQAIDDYFQVIEDLRGGRSLGDIV